MNGPLANQDTFIVCGGMTREDIERVLSTHQRPKIFIGGEGIYRYALEHKVDTVFATVMRLAKRWSSSIVSTEGLLDWPTRIRAFLEYSSRSSSSASINTSPSRLASANEPI
ncbi:hypothetical protein FOA52_004350 [Chlamydomonas sp. UWO 241]|nr:hypothetical protein FOA52_004350 [Chlamydomonas sp. UWO 241]